MHTSYILFIDAQVLFEKTYCEINVFYVVLVFYSIAVLHVTIVRTTDEQIVCFYELSLTFTSSNAGLEIFTGATD